MHVITLHVNMEYMREALPESPLYVEEEDTSVIRCTRTTTTSASSYCYLNRDKFSNTIWPLTADGYARAELRRVTTSTLPAVGSTRRETSVALAADLLVAVVF